MSINLLRNSKVYFSTNVKTSDGVDIDGKAFSIGDLEFSGHSATTTREIQVLDDLSFSQTTAVETIGVNETGATPLRGQRTFNTALNPVDFNFTTYMRPGRESVGGSITTFTATYGGASVRTSGTDTEYQAETALTGFGPNTVIVASAPTGGTAPTFVPVFKASGDNAGKLVGLRLGYPGTGFAANDVVVVNVIDPDTGTTDETSTWVITVTAATSTNERLVDCEESVLWNAMFSATAINTTGTSAWNPAGSTSSTAPALLKLDNSAVHQLQRFSLIVVFDTNTFILHDCSLNTATIDFGIDAIASIQWSGQARKVERVKSPTITEAGGVYSFSGTTDKNLGGTAVSWGGSFKPKITTAPFISNKLSTVELVSKIGSYSDTTPYNGNPQSSDVVKYAMPLTGGSITLTNNITYLTPAYMGSINQPVTYFTGSRSITGSLTAYLRSGTISMNSGSGGVSEHRYSAGLFSDLVNKITTDSDPEFYLELSIGGMNANTKVQLEMPGVVLTIPTVNAEQVITTTVNFTAQGTESNAFDITKNNEIRIKYFAA